VTLFTSPGGEVDRAPFLFQGAKPPAPRGSGEGKYQRIAMITIQRGADGAPLTRSLPLATSPVGRGY